MLGTQKLQDLVLHFLVLFLALVLIERSLVLALVWSSRTEILRVCTLTRSPLCWAASPAYSVVSCISCVGVSVVVGRRYHASLSLLRAVCL